MTKSCIFEIQYLQFFSWRKVFFSKSNTWNFLQKSNTLIFWKSTTCEICKIISDLAIFLTKSILNCSMTKSEIVLRNSQVLDFQEKNTSVGSEKVQVSIFWKKNIQVSNFNNSWLSLIFSLEFWQSQKLTFF